MDAYAKRTDLRYNNSTYVLLLLLYYDGEESPCPSPRSTRVAAKIFIGNNIIYPHYIRARLYVIITGSRHNKRLYVSA